MDILKLVRHRLKSTMGKQSLLDTPDAAATEFDRLMAQQAYDDAIQHLEAALVRFPKQEWLLYRKGSFFETRGDKNAAEALWTSYIEDYPDNPVGYRGLGQILTRSERFNAADHLLAKAVNQFPEDLWTLSHYADVATARKDWPEAELRWQTVFERFPEHVVTPERLIQASLEQGHLDRADRIARKFMPLFPDARLPRAMWADIPMKRHNRYAAARRWRELWHAQPQWLDAAIRCANLFVSALCFADALKIFVEADTLHPGQPEVLERIIGLKLEMHSLSGLPDYIQRQLSPELRLSNYFQAFLLCREASQAASFLEAVVVEAGNMLPQNLETQIQDFLVAHHVTRYQYEILVDILDNQNFDCDPNIQNILKSLLFQKMTIIPAKEEYALADIQVIRYGDESQNLSSISLAINCGQTMKRLNTWMEDRRLKAYQYDLFTSGTFNTYGTFLSEYELCGSMLFAHTSVAYCFRHREDVVWCLTSGHGLGSDIGAIYLPAYKTLVVSAPDFIDFFLHDLPAIDAADRSSAGPGSNPVLLIGHNNYAHFIWNELPALIAMRRYEAAPNLLQSILFEPYGPWATRFEFPQTERPQRYVFNSRIYFYSGAIAVTEEAKSEVIRQAKTNNRLPDMPDEGRFKIWISLRLMYRHAINQEDFLVALAETLAGTCRQYDLVLDGLSLPWDIDNPDRYIRQDDLTGNAKNVSDLGMSLKQRLDALDLADIRVIDMTAADLCSATTAAGACHYYICHQGTQQHKIGWVYDIPGLIHTNKHFSVTTPSGEWVQVHCNGESEALILPASLIQDVESGNDRQDNQAFRDYAFSDPFEAAKWCVARIAEAQGIYGST